MGKKQKSRKGTDANSTGKSAEADLEDIFSVIKKPKQNSTSSSSSTRPVSKSGRELQKKTGAAEPARPKSDGLYHAPDTTKIASMRDDDFFQPSANSIQGRKRQRDQQAAELKKLAAARRAGGTGAGDDNDNDDDDDGAEWGYDRVKVARAEGVDRIVSMSELKKMLSGKNSRAGTTPNCPFDCDCCF